MGKISRKVKELFLGFLPKQHVVDVIVMAKGVAEDIIDFAKANHPAEFAAILKGKIDGNEVRITGIIYQHYDSSKNSAVMMLNLPMINDSVGSVHSHPGPDNRPSAADRQFFSRRGIANFIISAPYRLQDLACYDHEGNKVVFSIL
jgi:proteasome lid subunit RPN8/RPN11